MLSSLRAALRQSGGIHRIGASGSYVRRAAYATRTRSTERYKWVPVALGALTLSASLAFANVVRLDSAEGLKTKPRQNLKKAEQAETQEPKPEELPQVKEDEARSDTSPTSPNTDSLGESDSENGNEAGGAFNPETGEINWDCPCLGGMAHGPCGQEFRDAFSCFVYSQDEPKGINCVELFKTMQDCFRKHPEVYGEEIMADDGDDDDPRPSPDGTDSPGIQGEALPEADPVATPTPGIVSPSS
ncbi:uncharacterized protein FOMMEDRAFT_20524 [Fomitiporia mediterranea MF3/22]|uniref:uncharacterized protein n=1 Tax=Fomitiporia mediterranea (strain MF3/22) TaxID=694068 RepID=UPI0004408243|nr:uncharacterized protein FOMMEDRAFT_20524 [Fomitiporia mediterranea MF3/22]EJD03433.1 hypothetical protein FOMMEDRAFT_20524 [Fomitiporia mediterranea MF3/22]